MIDENATEYVRLLRHVNGLMQKLAGELGTAIAKDGHAWARVSNASANVEYGSNVHKMLNAGMDEYAEAKREMDRIRDVLDAALDGEGKAIWKAPPPSRG